MTFFTDQEVAWLRRQFDADERLATLLAERRPGPWTADYDYSGEPAGATAIHDAAGNPVLFSRGGVPADYVIDWAPDRVLAWIGMARKLLDWLVWLEDKALDGNWWNIDVDDAVRLLAGPYTARPGFPDRWRAVEP